MTSIRAHRGALTWAAAMIAVLAGSLLLAVGAAGPSRAAESVEFTLVFEDLVPGELRTQAAEATLERDATLTSIEWVERTGLLADGSLDVTVCRGGACTALSTFAETPMPAGVIEVSVTVGVDADAPRGVDGTALGRLTFVADDAAPGGVPGDGGGDGGLPTTGASLVALVWGTALLATGALLAGVAASRSRARRPERRS
ncbi:hypothetical protein [Agromyces sp. Marseille-Q5079]|uniref:hypothetical protein n=1 Tax=Agromyces sp. Marseille-Q5079 TaxID=3439059 RepID=UPI003D9C8F55